MKEEWDKYLGYSNEQHEFPWENVGRLTDTRLFLEGGILRGRRSPQGGRGKRKSRRRRVIDNLRVQSLANGEEGGWVGREGGSNQCFNLPHFELLSTEGERG